MAYELKLPDLGEGLTEGEVARWLVTEGQEVAEDDPLVEIGTDKTTVEIPSPAAGTVSRILVGEGEVVAVGTLLVVIGEEHDGEEPRAQAAPRAEAPVSAPERVASTPAPDPAGRRIRATPLVRRLANELGVNLDALVPTGPGRRIVEADVRAAAPGAATSEASRGEGKRIPLRGVRRRIAEHLSRAHSEVPAVTFVEECDFTEVDRAALLPRVLRSAALSLRDYPELNARLEGEEIVLLDRYDVGVAIQTDEGLVVPVVRGCDGRSLEELGEEVRRLADAARAGRLRPEELRGSTFTVTSAGKLGGLLVTPLVNHPEVGILGVHKISARPAVRDGEIVIREIGCISVTFDHRVVDGARAAAFALDVIGRLEGGARAA